MIECILRELTSVFKSWKWPVWLYLIWYYSAFVFPSLYMLKFTSRWSHCWCFHVLEDQSKCSYVQNLVQKDAGSSCFHIAQHDFFCSKFLCAHFLTPHFEAHPVLCCLSHEGLFILMRVFCRLLTHISINAPSISWSEISLFCLSSAKLDFVNKQYICVHIVRHELAQIYWLIETEIMNSEK